MSSDRKKVKHQRTALPGVLAGLTLVVPGEALGKKLPGLFLQISEGVAEGDALGRHAFHREGIQLLELGALAGLDAVGEADQRGQRDQFPRAVRM